MLIHGLMFAYRPSSFLKVRLRLRCPFPIGVAMGPFSPTPFFSNESSADLVTILKEKRRRARSESRRTDSEEDSEEEEQTYLFVSGSMYSGEKWCSSHCKGTPAVSKTRRTLFAISGPMPSPGKKVATGAAAMAELYALTCLTPRPFNNVLDIEIAIVVQADLLATGSLYLFSESWFRKIFEEFSYFFLASSRLSGKPAKHERERCCNDVVDEVRVWPPRPRHGERRPALPV